ncbi:MAG: DUF695 domain-containing protein [Crocinitomix sp.]|nr:DUF695 domain-containing protein [Crocinitomix sp.]
MGIFSRLFSKKEKAISQINEKPDHWDFYFLNVDDVISSIYLNLSLAEKSKNSSYGTLFWFSLKMNNPREDGLSSQEEFDFLQKFEDNLISFVSNNIDGTYVGRLTTNGRRDFYFYVSDGAILESSIPLFMEGFSNYAYESRSIMDSEWEQYYNFLYPSPRDLQKIMNRGVVGQLERNGDNLTKARNVFHWIYFRNEISMNEFIKQAIDWEYKIENSVFDKALGEHPYVLSISRIDFVDYSRIDEHTLPLWELAHENNAKYDGWETSVEKE